MGLVRFRGSRLRDRGNLPVMSNQGAANIAFNVLGAAGKGIAMGPLFPRRVPSARMVTSSSSESGLLNMTAPAAVRAALTSGAP